MIEPFLLSIHFCFDCHHIACLCLIKTMRMACVDACYVDRNEILKSVKLVLFSFRNYSFNAVSESQLLLHSFLAYPRVFLSCSAKMLMSK